MSDPMSDDVPSSSASPPNRPKRDGDASVEPHPSGASPPLLSSRTRLQLDILKATLHISKKRAASGPEASSSGDGNALEDAEPDASP